MRLTNRNLMILGCLALTLVVVAIVLYYIPEKPMDFKKGMPLVQGLDLANIGQIEMKKDDESVTLKKKDGIFRIVEKDNYPASMEQVNDLLIKCLDLRCENKMTESSRNHADLGVVEGESGTIHVVFRDESGEKILGLFVGDRVKEGTGAYARIDDQDTVYLVDRYLFVTPSPNRFFDRKLFDINLRDIERIDVTTEKGIYTIVQQGDKTRKLLDIPEGKQAAGNDYGKDFENVFKALTNVNFTDVQSAGKTTMQWEGKYVCSLKSGLSYTVQSAVDGDVIYLKVFASAKTDGVMVSRTDSEEELKEKEQMLLAEDKAKEFNRDHSAWIYEVPSFVSKNIAKDFDELIEDIPVPETTLPVAGD